MERPLGSKYLILVPTVLNIAIIYMLVQPLDWFRVMITPLWQTVLLSCGVAMTCMMALAYVRLHENMDVAPEPEISEDSVTAAGTIPTGSNVIGNGASGTKIEGEYETSETEQAKT
jgi:hypothetical protein